MSHPLDSLLLSVDSPTRLNLTRPAKKDGRTAREPILDKEGNPAYIDHLARDSAAAKNYWRAFDTDLASLAPVDREKRFAGYLAAITTGWYLVGRDGEKIDYAFSPSNAKEFYLHPGAVDICEQLAESAGERANFAKASSTN